MEDHFPNRKLFINLASNSFQAVFLRPKTKDYLLCLTLMTKANKRHKSLFMFNKTFLKQVYPNKSYGDKQNKLNSILSELF